MGLFKGRADTFCDKIFLKIFFYTLSLYLFNFKACVICLNMNFILFFLPLQFNRRKLLLTGVSSQYDGITKWKKANKLSFGLFHLNCCTWLLEIDIFSVMVKRILVCWIRLADWLSGEGLGDCIKCLKRGGMKKMGGKSKIQKREHVM